jgi:D-glycero-alpha-D-manno-heptose-7-phosphate kinase
MLFYTGVEQSAEQILSDQTKRIGPNTDNLKQMLAMVDRAEAILANGDLDAFGDLLHETWTLKRGLSNGISNSFIDQAYDAARKAGARGGKLLGAGGRGFLLLFADPAHHAAIRAAMKDLTEVDFDFSAEGSRIIFQSQE